ncbi:enoyl-CoA hydratase-related protein [Falsibacillus pallidus]|uniref:Short chain enoyl-CoA hydratase /enoyl-CoA hydratase n=1 Tax=Falsibacillus pallidus TaxID=493781 RepID=A0A370GWB9_9BACI|nr:enoyl-CoA hydratase-related protein [Falsibacillus pallidus]RDI47975.1 short chain enoyl-CoA hydratase /enoyl-CoA hydratase [Falsibacillus pallidus]
MYETILYEEKNQTAWITLNRPDKLNAFTQQMNAELLKAFKSIAKNQEVRAVVVTGAGRAFCSGQDLADVDEEMDHGEILRKGYNPLISAISSLEKPVIAAVNGVAAGAGLSLALACDFRLASEKASFMEAFIHVGLIPDSGNLYYLPRLIGHAKAMELAVLGEKIPAGKALELGLVTKVATLEAWEQEVDDFASKLAAMPTKAIGLIKRYLYQSWDSDLQEMLEKEAYAQRIAGKSEDHLEGLQAFKEKRKPAFQGK